MTPGNPEAGKQKYVCNLCRCEVEFDGEMPDDFKCPRCKTGKENFRKVE
ncbi:MAG: hypothetical protein PUB62_01685 [Prevotellaceae bacterium]|nr:hypothetical protein [Prevotellaceae bacterium]MDY6099756.1 hypothetical protein [Bacteroidaceae bacterium]